MGNLSGTKISEDILSPTITIGHSADINSSVIPEAFLSSPEATSLFENWYSKQSNPDAADALLKNLKQLSLSPATLQAALLFLQYQAADDLPKEFEYKTSIDSKGSFSDALPLYNRMLKVQQFPVRPKNSEQAELTLRMLLTVLGDVQLLTVFLVLQLQQLEQLDSMSPKERDETAWTALHVYAPLAGRLGIFWIKAEMEDHAFRQLEYENYQNLKKKIDRKRSDRSESVKIISEKIRHILTEAGISNVETFVSLTNNDEVNILSALLAKRSGATRAVTLINKPSYIPLINTLGVNSVISPAQITVSSILSKIRSGSIRAIHSIIEDKGEFIEARALESSKIVGKPLKDLKLPKSICVGAIFRGNELIIPQGDTIIEVNDIIVVFSDNNSIKKLESILSIRMDLV